VVEFEKLPYNLESWQAIELPKVVVVFQAGSLMLFNVVSDDLEDVSWVILRAFLEILGTLSAWYSILLRLLAC
jgi:hypothetical protein